MIPQWHDARQCVAHLAAVCLLAVTLGCGGTQKPTMVQPGPEAQPLAGPQATDRAQPADPLPASTPAQVASNNAQSQAAREALQILVTPGSDPEAWDAAQQRLVNMGAEAVPVLIEALQSQNAIEREAAATVCALAGASDSALQAALVECLSDDSAFVRANAAAALASVPAGCDMLGPDVGRAPGWPQWVNNTGNKDKNKVREASRYFDVANFASQIKCPVLIGCGLIDETCPPEGIIAATNQMRGPKEVVILPISGHQNENGSQAAYDKRCYQDWLPALRQGKPIPK